VYVLRQLAGVCGFAEASAVNVLQRPKRFGRECMLVGTFDEGQTGSCCVQLLARTVTCWTDESKVCDANPLTEDTRDACTLGARGCLRRSVIWSGSASTDNNSQLSFVIHHTAYTSTMYYWRFLQETMFRWLRDRGWSHTWDVIRPTVSITI